MKQQDKHFFVAAAGSGGHVFPGLALANSIIAAGGVVTWVGTHDGIEQRVVSPPITRVTISARRVRGKRALTTIRHLCSHIVAFGQSIKLLCQQRPVAVIVMGGYVSLPIGLAAWCLRIPLIVHEQNAIPGTANRLLAPLARRLFTGFPGVFGHTTRTCYVGNPLRPEITRLVPSSSRLHSRPDTLLRLLVLGGSQGADAINKIVPSAVRDGIGTCNMEILHQTGSATYEATRRAYGDRTHTHVEPFIHDMASAYEWADLVIARAGALTISELACAGLASILIPFPYAIDDHQTKNASLLVASGAAIVLQEDNLTPEILAQTLVQLTQQPEKLINMAHAAHRHAKIEAAQKITSYCMEISECPS